MASNLKQTNRAIVSLRLPVELKERLEKEAIEYGVTLNAYIVIKLQGAYVA